MSEIRPRDLEGVKQVQFTFLTFFWPSPRRWGACNLLSPTKWVMIDDYWPWWLTIITNYWWSWSIINDDWFRWLIMIDDYWWSLMNFVNDVWQFVLMINDSWLVVRLWYFCKNQITEMNFIFQIYSTSVTLASILRQHTNNYSTSISGNQREGEVRCGIVSRRWCQNLT
jgi:hypothetical protein